ncbi:acyl carrier protein [bacterium]|nr:acyl carrier protein [bacterium]
MERNEIFNKVVELAVDKLSAEKAEIKEETNFIEDLNADSLDVVDFVMALEGEFDMEIPEDDVEKIKTVKDAVDYIVNK